MMSTPSTSYYLELLKNSLNFSPVSRDVNVFFDECNQQVFAVSTRDGKTEVQVKGPNDKLNTTFCVQDKGHVLSIKFSTDQRVLAIQRSPRQIDFINFMDDVESLVEYSQTCKGRNSQIFGFSWTGVNDIVFITNQGIEFYQVQVEKSSLKLLKNYHANVNWFVYLPESSVLLLSSGIMGNMIHPYVFRSATIIRLPKFEVENPPSTRNPQPASLLERDVTVATIYNHIYVVVLRNQARSVSTSGAEVVLYQLQKDSAAKKTDVLRLGSVGRFAVNVVDNLIVVHHQASKTSMLFDVGLTGEFDGQVNFHYPVLAPLPIQPYTLQCRNEADGRLKNIICESYSPNWVVFQPNIIIDAKLGSLWRLSIKLESLMNMIEDKGKLIDFLLLRKDSKEVILKVCEMCLTPGQQSSLSIIALFFDKINAVYAEYLELAQSCSSTQELTKENEITGSWFQRQSVIDQKDIYTEIFVPFISRDDVISKFKVAVLIEYVRSLNMFKIPVEYYLHEFIINVLVGKEMFYQLHQLIQYHVFNDSKPLACLLLSLANLYPPGYDLGLDMMKRLGNGNDEIIDVLLQKGDIVTALRFLRSNDMVDSAAPRKFLEVALHSNDDMTFYTVFTFFQSRNLKLRKNARFVRGEQCEVYEKVFREKFQTGKYIQRKSSDAAIDSVEI